MGKKNWTEADIARQSEAAKSLLEELQSDDQDLNVNMIEGETYFFEAIERALDEIDEADIMAVGLKAKIDELTKRKSLAENRAKRLKGLIEQAFAMAELDGHKFTSATVTIKATPAKLIITDESAIPSRFWTPQEPKLDRKAVLDELKANKAAHEADVAEGEERKPLVTIAGAELSNGGTALQIRRS